MATSPLNLPMRLRIVLKCGCAATFGMRQPDETILQEDFEKAARCAIHAGLINKVLPLLGVGPWWTWDSNQYNRVATPARKLWTFEPEHLYLLCEQYYFVQGAPEMPFGPILRATWLNHIPVLH